MKITFFAICFIFVFNITFSQNGDYTREDYIKIVSEAYRTNLFNIDAYEIQVDSECGAYYDTSTSTLKSTNDCRGKFWMGNIPSLDVTYEFIFDFRLSPQFVNSEKEYPIQIMLGNSPNGFSWIGIDKSGKLSLSYRDANGFTDVMAIFTSDKVHFDKDNHIRFVQFPDGIFYIELNTYSRLSYDYEEGRIKKLPTVGLSNRISYYSNITIKKLEVNTILEKQPEDDFLTQMQNVSASMQADQLLGLDTDEERFQLYKQMNMMFDYQCYGNCNNGYGIYDYNDGVQYIGEWKDGKHHGKGKIYIDGELVYTGGFEKDDMHGYGEFFKDGKLVFKGQWNEGEPVLD
ncbi:MAG: hypothetical protein KDC67_05625 [Ignavibacteriae bacterium]|nr:hypothetical protein [Ignavibacteriota bacterium]